MKKLLLSFFLLLPMFANCQDITISQKIDLNLPSVKPTSSKGNAKANNQLIAGVALCTLGLGVGMIGADLNNKPQSEVRGRVFRRVGFAVFAIGAGFNISGIRILSKQ